MTVEIQGASYYITCKHSHDHIGMGFITVKYRKAANMEIYNVDSQINP